jgi:acetolactate synthase-1/2/3 large subunit
LEEIEGALSRRHFLSGGVAAGAALGLGGAAAEAAAAGLPAAGVPAEARGAGAAATGAGADDTAGSKAPISAVPAHDLAAETQPPTGGKSATGGRQYTITRPGADFMVDVIKSLDVEYVAANPGSTFRGLQEALVNYGGNRKPEWLTCCHEESSVAMAHGYYKIAGKPMMAMVHGTVGVQHASMAIYNAYADRIPILIVSGNAIDANTRRVPVEWYHSVQDNAAMVRDYTKWDDTPTSLQHFSESMVRAAKLANAIPGAPVMITVDMGLQEDELTKGHEAKLSIPKLTHDTPPRGDDEALRDAAKLFIAAENPVIFADRYARTERALPLLVELAELMQVPVLDSGNRVNFPSSHPLNQSGRKDLVAGADFILALEPEDLWGLTHEIKDVIGKPWESLIGPQAKVVTIGTGDLLIKANYQDFQRYSFADLAITGDPEATLPRFIEILRQQIPAKKKGTYADRRRKMEAAHKSTLQQSREEAALGWNLSPVHPARIAMELWDQVQHEDWSVVGNQVSAPCFWSKRLWPMDEHYSHTGGNGAAGVGYGLPAAVGSAIANRDRGRLSVNFQNDGDFMYAPGALWTAAHHRVPLLSVMFNNRGYHQELMHLQIMAGRHNRGIRNAGIGTALRDPEFNFAKIAEGMGVYSEGPISDPGLLREAIRRGIEVVKKGQPALIDVVSQPR